MFRVPSQLPWLMIFTILALCALSVYNLQETVGPHIQDMEFQQLKWFGIASVGLVIAALIDMRFLLRVSPLIYLVMNALLVLVLLIGKVVNGSRRWIDLGAFNFQPSEVAKIGLVVSLAAWFHHRNKPVYQSWDIGLLGLLIGLPMFLVFQEPDLGHTLMLLLITLSMCTVERFERRSLVKLSLGGLLFTPIAWMFVLKDYQKRRILTLIDGKVDRLGSGWHAQQSEIAVGSGGLTGQGQGLGSQVAGGFLPENHTDFVFAKLSEDHGLIGAIFALSLYLMLLYCILYTASSARDRFGRHVSLGVAGMIFWHVVMNVGMVLNLLPVTGVTLPILSYGGTSLVTIFGALGLVIACHGQRRIFV